MTQETRASVNSRDRAEAWMSHEADLTCPGCSAEAIARAQVWALLTITEALDSLHESWVEAQPI